MNQRLIDLYDEYTHGSIDRRVFLARLAQLTGGAAAAVALVPMLQANQARAALVPPSDPRLETDQVFYPGAAGNIKAYLARLKGGKNLPAVIVILIYGESETGAMLIFSQVVLSLQLGFAIIPLIHFNSDREKMGEYVIKPWMKISAWIIAAIIVSLNVKLVIQEQLPTRLAFRPEHWREHVDEVHAVQTASIRANLLVQFASQRQ